jgi:hypothetical protein
MPQPPPFPNSELNPSPDRRPMKKASQIHISKELYLILDKLRIIEHALTYGRNNVDDAIVGALATMTGELRSQLSVVIEAYTEREIKRVDERFPSSSGGSSDRSFHPPSK